MTPTDYRFHRFTRDLLLEDLSFHGGPKPGEELPEFSLVRTDGSGVSRGDLLGEQPVLMIFTSFT